jgi:hypothetical protein
MFDETEPGVAKGPPLLSAFPNDCQNKNSFLPMCERYKFKVSP